MFLHFMHHLIMLFTLDQMSLLNLKKKATENFEEYAQDGETSNSIATPVDRKRNHCTFCELLI